MTSLVQFRSVGSDGLVKDAVVIDMARVEMVAKDYHWTKIVLFSGERVHVSGSYESVLAEWKKHR
jgi:hypothetical protein